MAKYKRAKKTPDRKWEKEEIEFLINSFRTMISSRIGVYLNRTPASVNGKKRELGLKKRSPKNPPKIGERFHRLTVIEKLKRDIDRFSKYRCLCDCGNITIVIGTNLTRNHTMSCGCYNSDLIKKRERNEIGDSSLRQLERSCIASAIDRGIEYELTTEQFRNLIKQDCYWCDGKPRKYNRYYKADGTRAKGKENITEEWALLQWVNINGIDRVDSKIGYTIENCVPCCTDCNEMKMDRSVEEFISHAYKIVEHQEKKKRVA